MNKELLKTINNTRNELSSVYEDIKAFNSVRYEGNTVHLTATEIFKLFDMLVNDLPNLELNEEYCFETLCNNYFTDSKQLSGYTVYILWAYFKDYLSTYSSRFKFNVKFKSKYVFILFVKQDYKLEKINHGFLVKKDNNYILDYLGVPLLFHSENHFLQYSALLKTQGLDLGDKINVQKTT